jgi:hypothetical protein
MSYLRVTYAEWDIDVDTPEGSRLLGLVRSEGMALLQRQRGFVCYRLVRLGPNRTVALVEWESEDRALAGATTYRGWMEAAGIMHHVTLMTESGPVLIALDGS